MNMKSQEGKKRIAHVGSSSSNTVENAEKHQNDYLATIMARMDSNDKQIVSYEQLNDYRKTKFKPVLPDIDMIQPVESSGSFKLKKKPCPLMAKCQKNLKYLKHNRRIPKPRAHVGSFTKEIQSVKLFTESKKNIDKINPRKVQKNSSELSSEKPRSSSLHTKAQKPSPSVVNKPNEEWNDKFLKSQNGTETKKKISKSKPESHIPVEPNSSEESDNFESFIKQVVSDKTHKRKQASAKKRKNVQKRKVFKRIRYGSVSSFDSDSDNKESSSKTALNLSLKGKKFKKSNMEDLNYNSDNESRDNSHQFDFDNACDDDSSDSCELNKTRSNTPQIDNVLNFSSNSLNNIKTVEQSVDIVSNNLSSSCLSSSNIADCSKLSSSNNQESNLSENSLPVDQVSSSKQELCESKKASEQEKAGGYESDDCVILEDSSPEFNIRISAVKSVAMLPTTDEDENAEAVLDSNSPQKKVVDKTSKNECNKLDSEIKNATLDQQAGMSLENESIGSVLNITNPNKPTRDESDDDCMIIDNEPLSESPKQNSRVSQNPLKNCVSKDTKQSAMPSLKVYHENESLNSIKDTRKIEDSNPKELSLASSRYKPDIQMSEENVWDVLKAIDFEKLKSLPQLSTTQSSFIPCDSLSNSLPKEEIKREELSNVSIAYQIQNSSSLPQEKSGHADPESCSKNSTSSNNYEYVDLIDLSDNEDTCQNEIVESTNQNLDFISHTVSTDATIGSTSSMGQKDLVTSSKYFNFEVKTGDVSSSGVLDENDLNFHKSLISNDFTHNKFLPKQEATSVVKKETPSTSDELDTISAYSLQSLYSAKVSDFHKLLELYQKEYQQYLEIKRTGINLSDGLSLLLKKQEGKLCHLKSSIKNIVKHDPCYLKESIKVKPELKPINCDAIVKKEPSSHVSDNPQFSDRDHPELSIYTESVLRGIQKMVGDSLPSESSLIAEKVKEQLRNVKCAQCGRTASAACQGCFKVFYCSTECGMSDWEKGHSFSCGT